MTKADLTRRRDLILAHWQASVAQGEPLMVRMEWDAPTLIKVLASAIRGWEQDRPEEMVSVITYGPGGAVRTHCVNDIRRAMAAVSRR